MARRKLGAVLTAMIAAAQVVGCGGGGDSGGAAAPGSPGVAADVAQVPAPALARPTTSNGPPVISGTPATQVQANADYEFRPVASDPDADPLRFNATNLPPWASLDGATGRLFGRPQPNDKGVYGPITVTVTDGLHIVALPAFEVSVDPAKGMGSIKLSWRVPETNEDGSLIGVAPTMRIHFGRASRAYDMTVTLPEPGVSRHQLNDLDSGTWYFAMSSINAEGLESTLSPEMVARVN